MKKPIVILAYLVAVLLIATPAFGQGQIAKVSVLDNGQLLLNGQESSLMAIGKSFRRLAKEHGCVWYYRQNAREKAPAIAMDVVKLVVKNRLPISFSSKADFSDYIDMNGQSHLRKAEPSSPADSPCQAHR